jgi:hypothetical protein
VATSLLPDLSGDEFEKNARSVLSDDDEKFDRLLKLRRDAMTDVKKFRARLLAAESAMPSAEDINKAHNKFFHRAAKLLGDESFMKIFGVSPTKPVNIVDAEEFAIVSRR